MSADLRVIELPRDRAGVSRFLRVPYTIYRGDPCWVAPILSDRKKVLSDSNPFFAHAPSPHTSTGCFDGPSVAGR